MKESGIVKTDNPQKGLRGSVTIHFFRHGLLTKYADLSVLEEGVSDEGIFIVGIRLVITLQGKTELHFGKTSLIMDADERPQATLLSIATPTAGIKRFSLNNKQRELVIFMEPEWIKHSGFIRLSDYVHFLALQQLHLQPLNLLVNKRVLALAESLIEPQQPTVLNHLHKESICLALIIELLSQLPQFGRYVELSPERKRVAQLTQMLSDGYMDNWTLAQIAKEMHTNITTLQYHFKQVHGISIMAYLRQIKLERAYKALLQGASINQAAEMAGYSNPDNFTTAFRRYFNIVPSKVKKAHLLPFIG